MPFSSGFNFNTNKLSLTEKNKNSRDSIDIAAVTLNSVLKYYEENPSDQIKIPEENPGWLRPNTLFYKQLGLGSSTQSCLYM